jgi:type VI secretion system protein ImpA
MPLPETLINPIPGENPSGQNLRYDPVYDAIREARREEEVISAGVWSCETKKANFKKVIELSTNALSSKTKDLQIAAWLTEATLATEGLPGLTQGLNLLRGLLENFWDTLYPEIEDKDLEMRLGPVEWVATRLDARIRRVPLTKNKLDWVRFEESRRVAYEADASGNEAKTEARRLAIEEKKCTGEEFDEAAKASGPSFFEKLTKDLVTAGEAINALEKVSDEKYGRIAPSFANIRKAVSDLQEVVQQYWKPVQQEEPPTEIAEEGLEEEGRAKDGQPTRASRKVGATKTVSAEPASHEDAFQRLGQIARFLRQADPTDPTGYLILRSAQWGQLRKSGAGLDGSPLDPPPTEFRQKLKRLAVESQWNELLEEVELAMAAPWSKAWLDLQRHAVRACESLGYEAVAEAIKSELRATLADVPALKEATLADDTPAANLETRTWLSETVLPSKERQEEITAANALNARSQQHPESGPDTLELAKRAASEGRVQESIAMMSREILHEQSGRGRFNRKMQLAGICMATRNESLAYPILTELAEEIDRRRLDEWEEGAWLAKALGLLLNCLDKLGVDESVKQQVFQKICRLDPMQAYSTIRS